MITPIQGNYSLATSLYNSKHMKSYSKEQVQKYIIESKKFCKCTLGLVSICDCGTSWSYSLFINLCCHAYTLSSRPSDLWTKYILNLFCMRLCKVTIFMDPVALFRRKQNKNIYFLNSHPKKCILIILFQQTFSYGLSLSNGYNYMNSHLLLYL